MNITCPKCGFGRTVSAEKLPPKAVMATCPKCQHRFKFREIPAEYIEPKTDSTEQAAAAAPEIPSSPAPASFPTPEAQSSTSPPPTPPAPPEEDLWSELAALKEDDDEPGSENRSEPSLPVWERVSSDYPRAFAQTFLDVVATPKAFFSAMPVGHGFLRPLLFFLIIIQAVALSQAIWQLLGILPPSVITENLNQTLQVALVLVLYPLEVCLFLFLDTAINHFFLRLFGADTKGFEGTYRAVVYSSVPMLLMIIPYIGLPLAMIGTVVYKFLGLRHVHGATNKQILAVLVLPMLLAMAVAIILILVTGGA